MIALIASSCDVTRSLPQVLQGEIRLEWDGGEKTAGKGGRVGKLSFQFACTVSIAECVGNEAYERGVGGARTEAADHSVIGYRTARTPCGQTQDHGWIEWQQKDRRTKGQEGRDGGMGLGIGELEGREEGGRNCGRIENEAPRILIAYIISTSAISTASSIKVYSQCMSGK